MEQIPNYGDIRQLAWCVYCGGGTETRDHVPSKVLLDDPLPENLAVVPACLPCNGGFSEDETYFACLIECVLAGSTAPAKVMRAKVRRILERSPALASRIEMGRTELEGGGIHFQVEWERVENVVLKHARGHAGFDMNEPQRDDPVAIAIKPLTLMSEAERSAFEMPSASFAIWPEVGSRMMQRLVEGRVENGGWVTVQEGRYRYAADVDGGMTIRLVFSEYLACEVRWD